MLKCSLEKNKSYPVQNIFFNPSEQSYQLTLSEKPEKCPAGIFTKKNLEVKVVPGTSVPYLHFNKQDSMPELVLNNLTQIQKANSRAEHKSFATSEPHAQNNIAQEKPHFGFLYIILAAVLLFLVIRFFMRKNQQDTYNPNAAQNNNLSPYNNPNTMNNPYNNQNNNPYNNNPNNNPNNMPPQQGPSRTASFLSGLAGGAVGAVVGNEIYDKLKGGNEAQASQNQNIDTNNNSDNMFSSDDNSDSGFDDSDDDDNSFSGDN